MLMEVWRVTLLLLITVGFSSFAWALRGHFVSDQMSVLMRFTAVFGAVSTGLQSFAIFEGGNPGPGRTAAGALLYALSIAAFWWTVTVTRSRRLSVAFSGAEPDHLLQTGPYRFVRHPFYVAYSLFWIAGVVAVFRWYLIPCITVMFVAYFCAARMEESKFESSNLGELYESYRARTGMFVPRLRRSRGAS